ncbi:DUF222 domain-containing protein [Microbacterium sp. 22242]|uniref:DUF222 domain-containing protein n=1 Tax=Microbacterium sp. 22242 TaxID=3453896 RepID=UPI003F83A7A7
MHAEVAAGIAHESRPELGPDSLAKQQGFRTPAKLIAGVQPREEEVRARRSLRMWERDGAFHLELVTDTASAAPVRAALQGYVSAAFAARKTTIDPDAPDTDRRTVEQLRADALGFVCQHALDCTARSLPLAGAAVVVRVELGDLRSGVGSGRIDGSDQPVSIAAVRRMAADGGIIPCVLGGKSEILDWGRGRRLFSSAQKLALAERDGGCAMCALPVSMTKVHHIDWWKRHRGRTDLANGAS